MLCLDLDNVWFAYLFLSFVFLIFQMCIVKLPTLNLFLALWALSEIDGLSFVYGEYDFIFLWEEFDSIGSDSHAIDGSRHTSMVTPLK